jgi:CBS domain-containing protein
METVRSILEEKGNHVYCISPNAPVFAALEVMAKHDVGALVVREGELPLGLFGEREYARNVILTGRTSRELRVAEVMSLNVPCVSPGESVEYCMRVMTQRRVRHLPVTEAGQLVGLVSIGDVVHSLLEDRAQTILQLHEYIWTAR